MLDPDQLTANDIEKLKAKTSEYATKMVQLHHKIDYLEELRSKGSIPNSYIAFEVIKEVVAHCENGFENDDVIQALPEFMGKSTVEIPTNALYALMRCWDHYQTSENLDLNVSFGMRAKGNSRKPHTKKGDFDTHYYYAQQVLLNRISLRLERKAYTYEAIFEQIAKQEKASTKTIQNASRMHKKRLLSALEERLLASEETG